MFVYYYNYKQTLIWGRKYTAHTVYQSVQDFTKFFFCVIVPRLSFKICDETGRDFCAFFLENDWNWRIAIINGFACCFTMMFVGKGDLLGELMFDARKSKRALTKCALCWWRHMMCLRPNLWWFFKNGKVLWIFLIATGGGKKEKRRINK